MGKRRSRTREPRMPVHFFRVTPDPESDQYFRVEIFLTHQRLQDHLKIGKKNECLAMTVSQTPGMDGCLGCLYFSCEALTRDVMVHECVHAALAWWCYNHRTNKLDLDPKPKESSVYGSLDGNDDEEAIASAVQALSYQLDRQTARIHKPQISAVAA